MARRPRGLLAPAEDRTDHRVQACGICELPFVGASAAHTLYDQAHASDWGMPTVPQGFAVSGADETVRKLVPAPDDAHWTEFSHGRHFQAMEAPADLAADLRAFFGPLR